MAYIPPHKRHSKDLERPTPTPELLVPQLKRRLNLRPGKRNEERSGKIIYAKHATYVWRAVGLDGDHQFPSTVHFEPFSLESVELKTGEKPLVLVNSHLVKENEVKENVFRSPWKFLAETIWPDLLSSFQILRKEMECEKLEEVKPRLVARFGKILFKGTDAVSLESVRGGQVTEATLRQLRRLFYTNIPSSHLEKIVNVVVPKIGVDLEEEKEIYHIQLSDSTRPNSSIYCKCRVKEDTTLELFKVEQKKLRHLVVHISCLEKDQDLRLMLCSKRILNALRDDEMNSIRNLINSAVLDSEVKGGLRWPLGKAHSRNRYSVIRVWHTKARSFRSPSLRLKLRHSDRYDFNTSIGEATTEMHLNLKRIVSEIEEEKQEFDSIYNMFQDSLKLIWNNFLCWNHC